MDTYNVALFGLIGLVIALIVTGGVVSMIFGEEPTMGQLASGAAAGAATGGALGAYGPGLGLDLDLGLGLDLDLASMGSITSGKMFQTFQMGGDQEMKMGLPTF
jgi:hypothetical protein